MTAQRAYEAVFFDVGNTLLSPHPSAAHVCEEVLLRAGHPRLLADIEALMPRLDEYYEQRFADDDAFWASEHATLDVWVGMYSLLCTLLEVDDDVERLATAIYDAFGHSSRWTPFDDAMPTLLRLHASGVRLGVISNWDARLIDVLDGLGMRPLFETVVCSAAVGLHKPDPRIFTAACARLDVAPQRCVHVGDHFYSDVVGARAAGLSAILIDRRGDHPAVPVRMVRSLHELEEVL